MDNTFSSMDARTSICLLLDFYGQLLTDKTRETLELHFSEDLSLAEISESLGVSRQAVHDHIRRGMEALHEYETKLDLVSRYLYRKQLAQTALTMLDRQDMQRVRDILEYFQENA